MNRFGALLLGLLCACGGSERLPTPPRLVALDSVQLREPTGAPFGSSLGGFVRDSAGSLFIADPSSRVIQVYGRDGSHLRSIGRRGSGPGEFEALFGLALLDGNRILAVADPNRAVMVLLDAVSGAVMGELPYPGGAIAVGQWRQRDSAVMIPVSASPFPFLQWDRTTDSIAPFGQMPPEWSGSIGLAMGHGFPSIVTDSDGGWLALLQLVPGVVSLDSVGRRRALVPVPSIRRVGVREGAAAAARDASRRGERRDVQPLASLTVGMGRQSDGSLVLLHLDPVLDRGSGGLEVTSQRYFVSLLDLETGVACVDAEVPIVTDELAPHAFLGDTLFFLTQQATGSGDVARWLRPFLIHRAGCDSIRLEADHADPR